jgi:hypothetical protein
MDEAGLTSAWPAKRDTASSVRRSPMPGSRTLAPNREKNPSAAAPHRARAWDRSRRQASVRRPWPQRYPDVHRASGQ